MSVSSDLVLCYHVVTVVLVMLLCVGHVLGQRVICLVVSLLVCEGIVDVGCEV